MARHLDHDAEELFTVTGQSFDELHRLFGMRYPFGEYHQAFVPEFNAGAMESAACVTFRDEYIFESRTVRSQHIFRANVIAHEMAHMWFGDIVTPVWWDDLWLNESFAEYMGARVTASATEFTDAWLHDAYSRHQWGLTADQRPTTHPIAGNGARDASVALQNFDGISYAKGAVVIKQLNRTLGDDVFFAGVSDHFERHQYANATMADLVESWERAAGADLSAFRDGWLLTAGPDRLELDRTAGVVRRTPLPGHPASREHTLTIASAPADAPGSWTLDTLVVDADEVPVAVTDGPMVIDPHFETWAVTLVDPSSLPALAAALPATEDPLLRASVWNSVRNAFYHAQLDPADVLDLLEAAMPDEDTDDGIGFTLAWATGTVVPLAADPMAALARMRDVAARRASTAAPGSTLQLAAFRSQVAASPRGGRPAALAGRDRTCPTGSSSTSSCAGASSTAWPRPATRTATSSPPRSPTSRRRSPTSSTRARWPPSPTPRPRPGRGRASPARSTCPTTSCEAIGTGLWQLGQEDLTDAYVDRYFADLPATAEVRSIQMLASAASLFYPALAISEATVARANALLAQPDLHSMLRREVVDLTSDLEHRVAVKQKYP